MKKRLHVILITLVCILFSACDPGTHPIAPNEFDDVTCVELILYENQQQKQFTSWVPNHFDELLPFENDNVTLLETLPKEQISNFIQAFSETDILHTYYAYNSPKDICIRMHRSNGNFLIIWANYNRGSFAGYIGEYLADGTVLSFIGSFSALDYYTNLVSNFFDYDL